jgi:hypothetical protein
MWDFLKKIVRNISIHLAFGLKNAEAEIMLSKTANSDVTSITQNKTTNELADALLKGEVTEEVELLRDRTYFVLEESKKYKVTYVNEEIGEINSSKKLLNANKPKVFNESGYNVKLIQENYLIANGFTDRVYELENDLTVEHHPIKFTYEYNPPKFKLDKYIRKIVVRVDKDGKYRVDLYSPKHTDSIKRMEKIFNNELKNIFSNTIKYTSVLFKTVSFITENAYGAEDLQGYNFTMDEFISITDIKTDYILTYNVTPTLFASKITDKYIKPELREKYKNKSKKNTKSTAHFDKL